jgi:hypothetical protein
MLLAPYHRKHSNQLVGKGHDANPVKIGKSNIRQRSGHFAGIIELIRIAHRHTSGAVEQEIDIHIFFFFKPPDQSVAESGIDIPIEIAQIIAEVVIPVIGKDDPAPHLPGTPVGKQLPLKHPPGDQRQKF